MQNEIQECLRKYKEYRESINFERKPIPDHFWVKFKKLYQKYPQENIRNIFNLNKASWEKKVLDITIGKKKSKNTIASKKGNSKKSSFIVLPPREEKNFSNDLIPLMQLKLKNGTEITVFQ